MNAHLLTLQSIFREVFDEPGLRLTAATTRSDIPGWDSVAQVKLILAVEEQLDLRFSEAEVPGLASVAQFLEAIERQAGP